jgi:hypothetical protein
MEDSRLVVCNLEEVKQLILDMPEGAVVQLEFQAEEDANEK